MTTADELALAFIAQRQPVVKAALEELTRYRVVVHQRAVDTTMEVLDGLNVLLAQAQAGNPDSKVRCQQLLQVLDCLLYTSPSPRDLSTSRMPSSA